MAQQANFQGTTTFTIMTLRLMTEV